MTVEEIETAVQAFAAAGAERGVFYLSTPITTGRRELELMDKVAVSSRPELRRRFLDEWRRFVVEPNEQAAIEDADRFVDSVALGRLVVNPVRIHRDHWSQSDYDHLWHRVIHEFPVTVVPVDGWAFSRGARLEVGLALQLGLPVVRLDGSIRTQDDVAEEASRADAEIARRGWTEYIDPLPSVVEVATSAAGSGGAEPPDEVHESYQRQVLIWLSKEHSYQVRKFGTDQDDFNTREGGLSQDGWWARQLEMYFHRARVLGLDTPVGRQALAKYAATACGMLESVVRVHGPLPPAGVPSGELNDEK